MRIDPVFTNSKSPQSDDSFIPEHRDSMLRYEMKKKYVYFHQLRPLRSKKESKSFVLDRGSGQYVKCSTLEIWSNLLSIPAKYGQRYEKRNEKC